MIHYSVVNPDELVWSHVGLHKAGKKIITGTDQFKEIVRSVLRLSARVIGNIVSDRSMSDIHKTFNAREYLKNLDLFSLLGDSKN
jgi:hypothetical protein